VRRRCCRAWLRLERELVTIRIGVVGTGVMGAEQPEYWRQRLAMQRSAPLQI